MPNKKKPVRNLDTSKPKTLSRRKFTKISLTAIAAAGVTAFLEKTIAPFGTWGIEKEIGSDNLVRKLVHSAFRLTDHYSLLNLEFYFINCKYYNGKVWAKYGPYENYMIVRLPQQHIAEQNFSSDDSKKDFRAATYISDYSYLVFRILFPDDGFFKSLITNNDGKYAHINLTKNDLLDWGCEEKFRLVVRQDLTESLFELANVDYYNKPQSKDLIEKRKYAEENNRILDSLKAVNSERASIISDSIQDYKKDSSKYRKSFLENHYPFQQKDRIDSFKVNINTAIYDSNRISKAYGDPITAIELPWRLIISPKIPDSSRFKFKWDIPETNLSKQSKNDTNKHRLWVATLSITERNDQEYLNRKKAEKKNSRENPQASTGSLDNIINQLELMILGSLDYKKNTFYK